MLGTTMQPKGAFMKNTWFKWLLAAFLCLTLLGCTNLKTNQQKGTAYGAGTGAAVGAILGQAIGKSTQATLLGAGIGTVIGGLTGNQVGKYMDLHEQELRDAVAASEAASVQRDREILRATFKGEAYFDYDESELKPGAYPELKRISDVLIKYPHTTIEVAGHTDIRGSEEYNQRLSERRAQAVTDELIQNGVSEQRITTVGYGESRPVSSDHARNRRVEVTIKPIRKS